MDYGFDSIKLDGCGAQLDLYKYETLLNATGKAFLIENCHWGTQEPVRCGSSTNVIIFLCLVCEGSGRWCECLSQVQ